MRLFVDEFNKPYEFISKLLIIVFPFLIISFIFGYYWMLLKQHSNNTSNMTTQLIEGYYSSSDKNINKDEVFKDITDALVIGGRAFVIVNEKDDPVFWANLPIEDDPLLFLEFCKKNISETVILKNDLSIRKLYYIPDDLILKVRYYPFFLLGSIILIIFMTGYLYMFMRRNEKQSIWIAMSKETAHQLGTPLTSLNGWREYLSELSKENDELTQVEEGIKDDIDKIGLVAERFSKISSEKEFRMCDFKIILEKSSEYIYKRITLDPDKISIKLELNKVPNIYANNVLIEWTIENLLKNSIESLRSNKKGEIVMKLFEEKNKIIIEISDNGSGIPATIRKNVFDTGFTTKKRGWGLGLSLAKKVVEQYHKGRIFVKETSQNGTIFRIELNKYV